MTNWPIKGKIIRPVGALRDRARLPPRDEHAQEQRGAPPQMTENYDLDCLDSSDCSDLDSPPPPESPPPPSSILQQKRDTKQTKIEINQFFRDPDSSTDEWKKPHSDGSFACGRRQAGKSIARSRRTHVRSLDCWLIYVNWVINNV